YLKMTDPSKGFGFLSEVSEKALMFRRGMSLSGKEVILLITSSKNLSPADSTASDYDEIPDVVSRFFKVKDVIRYDIEEGPMMVEGDIIFDFVVNAVKNENSLKAHLKLPLERTVYFILRNPTDVEHFKNRNFVVTFSTKPLSIYKSLEHLIGRCGL
ncbi:MAG: glycoside hydrolase family 3 protein, partial [Thermotoga sp.]|nr:glycoside hydrolase family 3 protein [Thermotoga sp.]